MSKLWQKYYKIIYGPVTPPKLFKSFICYSYWLIYWYGWKVSPNRETSCQCCVKIPSPLNHKGQPFSFYYLIYCFSCTFSLSLSLSLALVFCCNRWLTSFTFSHGPHKDSTIWVTFSFLHSLIFFFCVCVL